MGLLECMTYFKMYTIGRNSTYVVGYRNQYVICFLSSSCLESLILDIPCGLSLFVYKILNFLIWNIL